MPQFRDPIHGFIYVSNGELRIVDSEPFQRLRNIKQLATTYLVYHGAEHTRFGHSLGVMHLVTNAFNSALDNYQRRNNAELFDKTTREWYLQILRLIALTHDLGHAPFSHASEALFEDGIEHEDFTKKIIFETEIAEHIRIVGDEFRRSHNVGNEFSITPELLWMIYGEERPELTPEYRLPDYKFLKSFVDSELDCDKMDYLLRDSYYCGVNYGKFDLSRLIATLNVYKKNNIMQLSIERGGLNAFEEFVIARYFMFVQIYFHKTRRYLDYLLIQCIKCILPDSIYPTDVHKYLELDDDAIFSKIRAIARDGNEYAQNLLSRKVMSCVYQASTPLHTQDRLFYNALRNAIKACDPSLVVFEDSAFKLAHKIPTIEPFGDEGDKGIPVLFENIDRPFNVLAESPLLQSLDKPINIRRIYVDKAHLLQANAVIYSMTSSEEE